VRREVFGGRHRQAVHRRLKRASVRAKCDGGELGTCLKDSARDQSRACSVRALQTREVHFCFSTAPLLEGNKKAELHAPWRPRRPPWWECPAAPPRCRFARSRRRLASPWPSRKPGARGRRPPGRVPGNQDEPRFMQELARALSSSPLTLKITSSAWSDPASKILRKA
jgi:hypothetical protein